MTRLSFLWSFLTFFCMAVGAQNIELRNADLLFVTEGESAFSDAISESTLQSDSIKIVHVGILHIDGSGQRRVVEASPRDGVREISLDAFIASAPLMNGRPGVIVKRLAVEFPSDGAVTRALGFLGQPYDWWFMPDNGKMYCSELVYDSFIDSSGRQIFSLQPMNFRASDGSMPEFWNELYGRLGIPVPEGMPGTNPGDMSKDPRLIEVYRYF